MKRILFVVIATIFFAFSGCPLNAHVEDQYNSVHFDDGQPDFGTVPRRGVLYLRGEADDRPGDAGMGSYGDERVHVELTEEADGWKIVLRERRTAALLRVANTCVEHGDWSGAYRQYRTLASSYGTTGAVQDRLEVLEQAINDAIRPTSPRAAQVRRYFDALALDDRRQRAKARAVYQTIAASPDAGFLKPHVLYQLASLDYEDKQYPKALTEYGLALLSPHQKREAVFVMIARCAILPRRKDQRNLDIGGRALTQVLVEFPKTRFRRSILGLKARLDYLQGQYGNAAHEYLALDDLSSARMVSGLLPEPGRSRVRAALFAHYLQHLLTVTSFQDYEQTARQVDLLRTSFTPGEARIFSQIVLAQPQYASSYFYYRLYLCDNTPRDLARLARFAETVIASHPSGVELSPGICTRLAEVFYQDHQYKFALAWADRGMQSHVTDRGLFVRGAISQKLNNQRSAASDFASLLSSYPESPLRRSAREELAISDEALGDLGGSLDQYFALGYQYDIAFFLDARMSIPEVKAYVLSHENRSRQDMLRYSLGMRYLRAEQWADAEYWLRNVSKTRYAAFAKAQSDLDRTLSPMPLVTVRHLAGLKQSITQAGTRTRRANAMIAYADYYYTHGTLLLYNNALWQGERAYSFSFWWNTRHATTADDNAARRHMYQHEVYARAMALCREIVDKYPETPAAPRALYRAACCARRLANFNDWWRNEDKRVALWHKSAHWMNEVARRYPHSPLAHDARKYAYVFTEEQKSPW